ncbi:hypothetical protein U1Q18_044687, partial [Sarracenia purpurea var. burkii]
VVSGCVRKIQLLEEEGKSAEKGRDGVSSSSAGLLFLPLSSSLIRVMSLKIFYSGHAGHNARH